MRLLLLLILSGCAIDKNVVCTVECENCERLKYECREDQGARPVS